MNPGTTRLFAEAERRAERLIGLIRMAVAVLLAAALAVAVSGAIPAGAIVLERQLLVAALTLAGYFLAAVREACAGPAIGWRAVGETAVRGRTAPVALFAIDADAAPP